MSGMAIKFTSLAQIEAHKFVPADDGLFLEGAESFVAEVPRLRRCRIFCHRPLSAVAAEVAMGAWDWLR
jgi:hypothetical protein